MLVLIDFKLNYFAMLKIILRNGFAISITITMLHSKAWVYGYFNNEIIYSLCVR